MKNIAKKIQNVRMKLLTKKLKPTGKNPFAKYDYFELGDFIEPLNQIMAEEQMTAIPSFSLESASLTAIDFETGESYTITSPMGSANLKGCHEVQNIGAVETYQRRYLYQAMFDIKENDALNATHESGIQQTKKKESITKPQEVDVPQIPALYQIKLIIKDTPGSDQAHQIKTIIDEEFGGIKSTELTEEHAQYILSKIN